MQVTSSTLSNHSIPPAPVISAATPAFEVPAGAPRFDMVTAPASADNDAHASGVDTLAAAQPSIANIGGGTNATPPSVDTHANADARADVLVGVFSRLRAQGHKVPALAHADPILIGALARASGLYPPDVSAASLDAAHRHTLMQELVLALTRDIHWNAELRHGGADDQAVHVDHGVVGNARGLGIAAARDAVNAHIARILNAHGMPSADWEWMIPYLRDTLVADPTLSLQPPPADIRYGSRRWATLWMGMQAARDLGLPSASMRPVDLAILGQVVMADTSGTLSTQALVRMAQAAGAVDLADLTRGNDAHLVSRLQSFAREHFAAELPLLDKLGGLSRQALASELLKGVGIGADRQIEVKSFVIPAAWSSLKLEIPLLFASYRTGILDYYLERDSLSSSDIERLSGDGEAAPVDAEQALSSLPASLAETFNKRFDTYKTAASAYVTGRFDAWLSTLPELQGDAASSSRVKIATARLRRHASRPPVFSTLPGIAKGPPSTLGKLLSDTASKAYIVTIEKDGQSTRYIFDPATSDARVLPTNTDTHAWALGHLDHLFHEDPAGTGLTASEQGPVKDSPSSSSARRPTGNKTVLTLEPLGEGPRGELGAWLASAAANRIEGTRADAAGETSSDSLRELELGLIPFRSAFLAVRAGDIRGAIISGLLDVATFLPAIGAGLKAGMAASRAIGSAIEASLSGLRHDGLRQGFALVSRQARAYSGRLASRARGLATVLPDGATMRRLTLIHPAAMAGRMDAGAGANLAIALRDLHPSLAADVEGAASRLRGADVESGRWKLPPPGRSTAPSDLSATQSITQEPLYVTAHDQDGGKLALQHHGDRAYVRYNAETLEPGGPLLLPDSDGVLHASLPIDVLERHRVSLRATLDALTGTGMQADGTFALADRRFARIADDYVEVAADRAASTPDRPLWKVVEVPGPSSADTPPRLVYNPQLDLWQPTPAPGLKGGGNTITALRDMQAQRNLRKEISAMARQFQEVSRALAGTRYDLPSLNVWLYPENVREQVPELIGRSLSDHFIAGADGRIRRFPANFVTHGATIPGYAHLIDPVLLSRTGMMSDYSHLRGAEIRAGYRLDRSARTMSFRLADKDVPSLLPWCGVYPLDDGAYLVSAMNMAGDADACEEMLLAQGKLRDEVVEQLRDYANAGEFQPKNAIDRIVRSLSRRLCAMPQRIALLGVRHDEAIGALKLALDKHGPCILNRNGKMVMLDGIEDDAKGRWLIIRDPYTCSRTRIPERRQFWEGTDTALTNKRVPADWKMPPVDAIFLPKETRVYERARNLSGNLADTWRKMSETPLGSVPRTGAE